MVFDTERFITEIENRPCIWNSGIKHYADRSLKTKCWNELVDIFKEKEDMTKAEKKELGYLLQKKWKGIRGCYTREISRRKMLKSGCATDRKSEYVYFQQLQFLNSTLMRETDLDSAVAKTSQQNRHIASSKSLKRKSDEEDSTFKKNYNTEKHDTIDQDEDRLFMLSLVSALKRVPEHKKMATKIKIMSLLDEAVS